MTARGINIPTEEVDVLAQKFERRRLAVWIHFVISSVTRRSSEFWIFLCKFTNRTLKTKQTEWIFLEKNGGISKSSQFQHYYSQVLLFEMMINKTCELLTCYQRFFWNVLYPTHKMADEFIFSFFVAWKIIWLILSSNKYLKFCFIFFSGIEFKIRLLAIKFQYYFYFWFTPI